MMKKLFLFILVGFCMTSLRPSSDRPDSARPEKPTVIVLLGPPGSGKGTQAIELSKIFRIPQVSTGDLFRENISKQTPLGIEVQNYLNKGQLVPDPLVLDILFDRISKPDCSKGYILDGFPRTTSQAHELDDTLSSKVKFIIVNLKVSDDVLVRRLEGRLVCSQCNKVFHKDNNPPKVQDTCDSCGGKLYQRPDDRPDVIKERLRVYYEQTRPVEDFYRDHNMMIDVDASGSSESVLKKLQEIILQNNPNLLPTQ